MIMLNIYINLHAHHWTGLILQPVSQKSFSSAYVNFEWNICYKNKVASPFILGLCWTILPQRVAVGSQQNVRSLPQKSEWICVQYERRFRWQARCPLRHQIGLSVGEARHSRAFPLTGMKWNAQPVRGGQKTDTTRGREKEEEALLHCRQERNSLCT